MSSKVWACALCGADFERPKGRLKAAENRFCSQGHKDIAMSERRRLRRMDLTFTNVLFDLVLGLQKPALEKAAEEVLDAQNIANMKRILEMYGYTVEQKLYKPKRAAKVVTNELSR
jgi:predicted nucleic acid-binding Zn ribbon protein